VGLKATLEKEQSRCHEKGETVEARLLRIDAERERTRTNYDALKAEIKTVQTRVKKLKAAMKSRKERYKEFRTFAEATTKEVFGALLRTKGHDGDVLFDHQVGTIDITWHRRRPQAGTSTQDDSSQLDSDDEDKAKEQNEFTDAKALSGGERSMATLALLLALGKSVATPFKVMDEFDVYMDATTREIAIQQLLMDGRSAVQGVRKQCIFLSPLDVSQVTDGPDVRKQKMVPNASTFGNGGNRVENGVLGGFVQRTKKS